MKRPPGLPWLFILNGCDKVVTAIFMWLSQLQAPFYMVSSHFCDKCDNSKRKSFLYTRYV